MEIAAAPLNKGERLALFFALIKERNATFSECKAAYRHLSECLEAIEAEHTEKVFGQFMLMVSLSDFVFHKKHKLYVWESTAHAVCISKNGAYGIYHLKNPTSLLDCFKGSPIDAAFYRNATPLVLFASASGKELWKRKAPE